MTWRRKSRLKDGAIQRTVDHRVQPCQVTVWGEVSPDVSRCRGQPQSGQQRIGGMSPDEHGSLADCSVVARGTRWHGRVGDAIVALVYRSLWQFGVDFGDGIVVAGPVLEIVQDSMLKAEIGRATGREEAERK